MATLVFAAAASAVGTSAGLSTLGTTILATAASVAGSYVDNALTGAGQQGTRLNTTVLEIPQVLSSSYGRAIPLVYGTARVAGNVIWMSKPTVTTISHTQNVRSGKFSSKTVTAGTERYTLADMAIALTSVPSLLANNVVGSANDEDDQIVFKTRGGIVAVRRIWADSALIYDARTFNLSAEQTNNYTFEALYDGQETQTADDLIESIVGAGNLPAFRGLAYILLTEVRLSDFGNRVPNFTMEVVASLPKVVGEETPQGLAENAAGDIFVSNTLRRTITRFDSKTLKTKATLGRAGVENDYLGTLKAMPWALAITPDGHIWVTAQGDAVVQRLNPDTGAVIANIAVGNYPREMVVDNAGFVWVTFPTLNQVSKINPSTNTVTASYTVSGAPWAMCKGLDGNLWVTTNSEVVRLNPTTGAEIARISVGLFPWGIACNPVTGAIWTALSGEDILVIIDPATNTVVKQRNTGTYPTAVSTSATDEHGSVAVTLIYGNQLKVYSRTYSELLEYGTVAFPANCLHRANGEVVVTQSKYDFVMVAEGR
jgi:DNA-binding beta-propeller fold protein YncE